MLHGVSNYVTRGPYLLVVKTLQQAEEILAYVKAVEYFIAGLANFNHQEGHMTR